MEFWKWPNNCIGSSEYLLVGSFLAELAVEGWSLCGRWISVAVLICLSGRCWREIGSRIDQGEVVAGFRKCRRVWWELFMDWKKFFSFFEWGARKAKCFFTKNVFLEYYTSCIWSFILKILCYQQRNKLLSIVIINNIYYS